MKVLSLIKDEIVETGRRLYAKDLIVAGEGNISVRENDSIVVTPAGMCKGFLTAEDLVVADREGRQISGNRKNSTEFAMHLKVYQLREDIHAIVHAHPPHATGFAVAGIPLDRALLAEVVATLGCVPLAEYGTPATDELPKAIAGLVPQFDAILLANHGAIAYGASLQDALFKMQTLEHFAQIALVTRILGQEKVLPRESVDKLFAAREKYGIKLPVQDRSTCPVVREQVAETETIALTRSELFDIIDMAIKRVTEAEN